MVAILLTGATGYVGGRLLPRLLAAGHRVRCLVRDPAKLAAPPGAEVARGDVLDPASLAAAMEGVDVAYYLIHSMEATDFAERDRRAAANFAEAARAAGVRRIVYLGGLGAREGLSAHLASRQEVGDVLRERGPEVVEFRAAVLLGAGSASFELIRALVERLPAMTTPKWVQTPTQPIAIDDALAYLEGALALPPGEHRVFEIGGADVVNYRDMIAEYARQRGYRRLLIPVPVLTPYISALWLALVTPTQARMGRKLIEGLRNATVVRDDAARRAFPSIEPRGMRQAIAEALAVEDEAFAKTRWSEELGDRGIDRAVEERHGARLVDSRAVDVPAPPHRAFEPIRAIGGEHGWYFGNGLWALRGHLDVAAGGPGRRGRAHPEELRVGDHVDWWRVRAVDAPRFLRLRAEMRLPGRAWLDFEVTPRGDGARIRQTATFDAYGVAGRAYWWLLLPWHKLVFSGMLREIARRAGGQ